MSEAGAGSGMDRGGLIACCGGCWCCTGAGTVTRGDFMLGMVSRPAAGVVEDARGRDRERNAARPPEGVGATGTGRPVKLAGALFTAHTGRWRAGRLLLPGIAFAPADPAAVVPAAACAPAVAPEGGAVEPGGRPSEEEVDNARLA